jgi:hypothetical protein
LITKNGKQYSFSGQFTILYSDKNPYLALRPSGIKGVPYNVPTWETTDINKADLSSSKSSDDFIGDGFDDAILKGKQARRTSNLFNPGKLYLAVPNKMINKKDSVIFVYAETELFKLTATFFLDKSTNPKIKYQIFTKQKGYFSVGYTGAPAISPNQAEEIWQPLIWQEKRFPDNSYLTPSYMATLPTTLVNDGANSLGVLASPEYLPFDPLPLFTNSQFGISIRDKDGMAKPQVFAPILGGPKSLMNKGQIFEFAAYLIVEPNSITQTYEKLARQYFGFKDYRKNDISTLNTVFDNIVDYSLTNYAWYLDSLKGFAYSTDVPGAVKNVSSLNPLELAIITDNKEIFDKRAYPLMEYMLSREKFLFALDSTQKIQSPSRKLNGPIAPISELSSLYNIFGNNNPFYILLAKQELQSSRIRNLDVTEEGDTWINAMHLYKTTKDPIYLKRATEGADEYLQDRVNKRQTDFDDKLAGGFFFWTAYTNKWIALLELYEITKDKKYLEASQDGARHYTMFTWMSPGIPVKDSLIVNKGGNAPYYSYLKSKGHPQMKFPEEKAPAWRLSEIGLTPESSGTSTGHRAIFMANYAPWMLRLGYYTNDSFLKEVAKSAVIGRYRNFPGYHINTARTTAYEKFDFPYHSHKEQSVNSFHYNHIMPMASILIDYLITDAYVRSKGEINFPSNFIEGYAYLQSKFYGASKGKFYDVDGVNLWMPKKLLTTESVELNYISGRKGNDLYVSFLNQSNKPVKSFVFLNDSLLKSHSNAIRYIYDGKEWKKDLNKNFIVNVPANGIVTLKLENVKPVTEFQDKIIAPSKALGSDFIKIKEFGNADAMLIRMGNYANKAYIYLKEDDSKFSEVSLHFDTNDKKNQIITKKQYPFEFTVNVPLESPWVSFRLDGVKINGEKVSGTTITLGSRETNK